MDISMEIPLEHYNILKKFLSSNNLKILHIYRDKNVLWIMQRKKKDYNTAKHGEIYTLRISYEALKVHYYYKDKKNKHLSELIHEYRTKNYKNDIKFLDIMERFYKKYKTLIKNNKIEVE